MSHCSPHSPWRSSEAPPERPSKPGLAVFYYNTSPYGIAEKNAGVNAGKKAGFAVTTFTPNNDPKLEATQVQDAITSGKYKAFWMATLDPVSMAPVAKQAEAKGIKVGQADYTFGGQAAQLKLKATPGITTTVGSDQVALADVARHDDE